MAGLTPLKTRWLGPVDGRVALARPAEAFGGGQTAARPAEAFVGGQTAGLNAVKNRWLGSVAGGHGRKRRLQNRLHTCGGPRRRPCLGEGRGRRI